jgi:RimJ/RimL family protein N-acetyltransferase
MNPQQLIRLHLALECVGIDPSGELVRIPGPNPDTLHRVYVTRHAQGDEIFFQAGLPAETRRQLLQLPVSIFFEQPECVQAILAGDWPCDSFHIGKSYVFSESARRFPWPDVVRLSQLDPALVQRYDPRIDVSQAEVFGIVAGQGTTGAEIAATCESSRENEQAGEAWVRTREAFRRRGFASQVTAAWGNWLLQHGKTPFYSHRWDNLASQAVAQRLRLLLYVQDAGYA